MQLCCWLILCRFVDFLSSNGGGVAGWAGPEQICAGILHRCSFPVVSSGLYLCCLADVPTSTCHFFNLPCSSVCWFFITSASSCSRLPLLLYAGQLCLTTMENILCSLTQNQYHDRSGVSPLWWAAPDIKMRNSWLCCHGDPSSFPFYSLPAMCSFRLFRVTKLNEIKQNMLQHPSQTHKTVLLFKTGPAVAHKLTAALLFSFRELLQKTPNVNKDI